MGSAKLLRGGSSVYFVVWIQPTKHFAPVQKSKTVTFRTRVQKYPEPTKIQNRRFRPTKFENAVRSDAQTRARMVSSSLQYVRDKMGTNFDPNCKHFCPDYHFIEFPFYRGKIATLFYFFDSHFRENKRFGIKTLFFLNQNLSIFLKA